MQHLLKSRLRLGFTLVEILVVISIVGIITTFVANTFNVARKNSADSKRKENIKLIQNATVQYYQDNDVFPAANTSDPSKTVFPSDTGNNWIPDLEPYFDNGTVPKDPLAGIFNTLAQKTNQFIGTDDEKEETENKGPQVAAASSTTIDANTTDGWLRKGSTTNPPDGAACQTTDNTSESLNVGQQFTGGQYYSIRSYLTFNTSTIPSNATVTSAKLQLTVKSDNTSTSEFNVIARAYDWANSLDCADWDGNPPSATEQTSPRFNTASLPAANSSFQITLTNASIVKAGTTTIMLTSDRDESNTAGMTQFEVFAPWSANNATAAYKPKLLIDYTTPDPTPTPTPSSIPCTTLDVNDDGYVDAYDTQLVTNNADPAPYNAIYDVNSNGIVNSTDIALVNQAVGTPCTTGLTGYWNFNENAGTTASDASGNNYNGTLTNGPTWTTGKCSSGINFDGTNDSVNIPSTFGLGANNLSISAWVYIDSALEKGSFVKIGAGSDGFAIGVGGTNFDNTGNNFLILFEGIRWINTGRTFSIGWHHVAVSIASSGVPEGFLDGTSTGTFSGTNGKLPTGGTSYIGGYGTRIFNGPADEVKVYNKAISSSEVTTDMNACLASPIPTPSAAPSPTPTPAAVPSPTPTPTPSANITAAQTNIAYGTSTVLVWNSQNTTSCNINPAPPSSSNPQQPNGSASTGTLTTTTSYTLTCTPSGTSSVTVTVGSSASPPSAPSTCQNKRNIFCYIVASDKKSYVIWAILEDTNDAQIWNKPDATCTLTPPSSTYFNYCVQSPQI